MKTVITKLSATTEPQLKNPSASLCVVFNRCVRDLVEASLSRQEQIRFEFPNLSAKAWFKEFATVRVASGRRSGSTYTAINVAITMFKKPLIVCHAQRMIDMLESDLKHQLEAIGEKASTESVTIARIDTDLRGVDCDAVIVDCASLCSKEAIEHLYDTLADRARDHKNCCFILLN